MVKGSTYKYFPCVPFIERHIMELDEIIVTLASAENPKEYAELFLAKLDEKSTLVTKISSFLFTFLRNFDIILLSTNK